MVLDGVRLKLKEHPLEQDYPKLLVAAFLPSRKVSRRGRIKVAACIPDKKVIADLLAATVAFAGGAYFLLRGWGCVLDSGVYNSASFACNRRPIFVRQL